MRKVEHIIVHCSASAFGNANLIRKWHKERGWRDIGYHFVILNGLLQPNMRIDIMDGSIECGRDLDGDRFIEPNEVGAHALGYNQTAIGICMIGNHDFTKRQFSALKGLVDELMSDYYIQLKNVLGHYETENAGGKTCPNFDMSVFRYEMNGNKALEGDF